MVNTENVRLFMTQILDGHGNVVVMGEEIIPEVIESTDNGLIGLAANNGTVELKRPLRLVLNEKGVIPATLFNSKEWARIPVASSLEMNVHEILMNLYVTWVNEEYGEKPSIIMPEEKRIIL